MTPVLLASHNNYLENFLSSNNHFLRATTENISGFQEAKSKETKHPCWAVTWKESESSQPDTQKVPGPPSLAFPSTAGGSGPTPEQPGKKSLV